MEIKSAGDIIIPNIVSIREVYVSGDDSLECEFIIGDSDFDATCRKIREFSKDMLKITVYQDSQIIDTILGYTTIGIIEKKIDKDSKVTGIKFTIRKILNSNKQSNNLT